MDGPTPSTSATKQIIGKGRYLAGAWERVEQQMQVAIVIVGR
jgi:hypothetical protein